MRVDNPVGATVNSSYTDRKERQRHHLSRRVPTRINMRAEAYPFTVLPASRYLEKGAEAILPGPVTVATDFRRGSTTG